MAATAINIRDRRTNRTSIIRPAGFTLMELLVVVAAIVILLAIAMPLLGRGRETAQLAACMSNLRQIGHTTSVYSGLMYPYPNFCFSFNPGNSGTLVVLIVPKRAASSGWSHYNERIVLCPSDEAPSAVPVKQADGTVGWKQTSYGFNIELNLRNVGPQHLRMPSQTVTFYDGIMGQPHTSDPTRKWQGQFFGADDYVLHTFRRRHATPEPVGNLLFADGHVGAVSQIKPDNILLRPRR